MSIIEHSGSD